MFRTGYAAARARLRRALPGHALSIGCAAALLAPAWGAAAGEPAAPLVKGPAPVIELKSASQDAGTVEAGTLLKFHFTVANPGESELQIPQVKPSCGCTVPHWDKVIAPGKEGAIDAEVNTTAFRGLITKHLTVFTNDPAHPQLELTLTAKVTPLIDVKPGPSALLSIEDRAATQEFTLERTGGRPMKIRQVVTNAPYLKAETAALPGEGRYKVSLTASTDAPMGRSTVPVVVQTDLEKSPNLTLIVMVDHGILTSPPMVFFGPLPAEQKTPVQSVVTVMRQHGAFHLIGATADDPKLNVSLQTIREGTEYHVTVSYAGGWAPAAPSGAPGSNAGGVIQRTVTVTTDDPKQPTLKIPVQAMLPRQALAPQPSPPGAGRGGG
jgi:hypothetical protein